MMKVSVDKCHHWVTWSTDRQTDSAIL